MTNEQDTLKLSQQAVGTLLMTLQKCLAEESDITEVLSDWNLFVEDNEIFVRNPPTFSFNNPEKTKFEVE